MESQKGNKARRRPAQCMSLIGLIALVFITALAASAPRAFAADADLTLEVASACPGDSNGAGPGDLITVELWMRNLQQTVTGFQAFLTYDPLLLAYQPALSTYTAAPFPQHVESISSAEVNPGQLNLDGSIAFGGSGTSADALLATLVFEVVPGADCQVTDVTFRLNPPFLSEVSFEGSPIATTLFDSSAFTLDDTPPDVFTGAIDPCYPDQASAEAAALAATTATDLCTATPFLVFDVETTGPLCSATVTVSVEDECGNIGYTDYFTRIDNTAPVLADCPDDFSVTADPEECSAVVIYTPPTAIDACDGSVPVNCVLPSGSVFPAGDSLVTCTAVDACGNIAQCSFTVSVDAVRDRLAIEPVDPQDCYVEGEKICVDVWMRCLTEPVTGFNAFIRFDADILDFLPGDSSYTNSPFPLHIASPLAASIDGSIGTVNIDGSVAFMDPGADQDALLATLCFIVKPGMGGEIIVIDFGDPPSPTIGNELSIEGEPVPTNLDTFVTVTPEPRLRLKPITPPKCYEPHDLICVELRMECLGDQLVTGFNAFIDYDRTQLRFEPTLSSYTNSPFPLHINPIVLDPIDLDGSRSPFDPPVSSDATLATLCFRVLKTAGGVPTSVFFRPPPTPTIGNELSVFGTPIPTLLEDALIETHNLLKLRLCYQLNGAICVLLEMACPQEPVTGFTAYLEFDNNVLEFIPAASDYTLSPFPVHSGPLTPNILGPVGQFDLDGQVSPMDPGTTDDALLATMCFQIRPGFEDVPTSIIFRSPPPLTESTLLTDFGPLSTQLQDSHAFSQAGDIDLDGDVDADDLAIFAAVLVTADTDPAHRARCDLNCDDKLDAFDIMTFLEFLFP